MNFKLHNLLRAAGAAVLVFAATAANAAAVYDNLGAVREGSDALFGNTLANSFTTGSEKGYLSGVKALLKNGSSDLVGNFEVSLHANSANAPGAELFSLGTFSSAAIGTDDFAAYAFAPLAGFLLAANTRYWIEIEALDGIALEWSWASDLSGTGVANEYNYSQMYGANSNSSFAPYQMEVSTMAVPEPGSIALLALGLGLVLVVRRRQA